MTRWITAEVRQVVAARANFLCEYCLIGEADSFYGCEVDHIIRFGKYPNEAALAVMRRE